MGTTNSKNDETKRRTTFKKILRIQTTRPMSYAASSTTSASAARTTTDHSNSPPSIRPASMFEVVSTPFQDKDKDEDEDQLQSTVINEDYRSVTNDDNDDEYHWTFDIPLSLEKLRKSSHLKEFVYQKINHEFCYILNRLLRFDASQIEEDFHDWFFDELEDFLHSIEDNSDHEHRSLLLRSIESDRFDAMRYLFEHQLLPSKLEVNTINDQGRHCLLMLAHKNGPIQSIEYLLTHQHACLDTNKIDLNHFTALHHTCRHFNLPLSQLLLPHTNRKCLQIENSELHTPTDYWLECLCSLKKLKPTHIQHHSDSLRLDYLLSDGEYQSNLLFLQTLINHGGQITKIPLRYIRSILPQLTFEQKLSYVDHHVNLCCTFYKNRLSTLIRDYENLKVSIQAGEILTEFIYALGRVQLEVQNRFNAQNYSNLLENDSKQQEILQTTMRMLYFKFFRLFQCIYSNPDVNVKNFHFEHIFRRVWIYWKRVIQILHEESVLIRICTANESFSDVRL
uniref:Ankyrin repeat containing protein n=1 Tax=Philodina roseola TaxID=96448 RepID=B6S319_PHIRO|nr:ankyrin repeat containing protein [Philodina roseola]